MNKTGSNLERGLSLPGYETLVYLSAELGIPVEDFFNLEGNGKTSTKRTRSLITLMDMARSLDDRDLTVAVKLIDVLVTARTEG